MSKNLTRKGLALGAIVALGTSLFAGAPAQASVASTGISLAPTAGTTYTSIAGSAFSLTNTIDNSITTTSKTAAKLTYLISNAAGASFQVSYSGGAGTNAGKNNVRSGDAVDTLSTSLDTTDGSKKFTSKFVAVTSTSLGSNNAVDSSSTYKNKLVLTTSTDATENVVLTVTPFIDENQDGQISAYDLVGTAQTITWIPAANVTATTSIISAVTGASTITGKVVLGNDINMANLGTDVKIGFKKDGVVVPIGNRPATMTASYDSVDTSYDTTEAGLVNELKKIVSTDSGFTPDVVKVGTYVAQAYYKVTGAALGSASNAAAPANGYTGSVDSTDALEVTPSASVNAGSSSTVSGVVTNTTVKAKTGYAGNIAFSSSVTWRSTDALYKAAGAGVTVRVTLNGASLANGSSFTAGGKTVTNASGNKTFTVVTDATGAIAFTGAGTGAKGDAVTVTLNPLNKNGVYKSSETSTTTVTWEDAAPLAPVVTNVIAGVAKAAKGSNYTLNYTIVDQFGEPAATSGYRLAITENGANTDFAYYTPVGADGKVSQVIADNTSVAGSYTVAAQLQKLNTTTNVWASAANVSAVNTVVYVNATVPAAVTGTASSSVAVATIAETLVTADLRVDSKQTTDTIGYGDAATQTISGVVTDATGAVVPGATVNISAAGLAFVAASGKVFSVGSAVVNADANGAYSVDVYSTTAGKASVVVTSGAATKTVAIEFSGITAMANTNVLSLDVASLSQVGRSVTVTVKLVDKYGNAVDTADGAIAVAVTGVGSLSAATVGTGTAGTATVQFVAGANDFGDAVITAKYTATDAAATVVSASKTVTVGLTDAQVDIVGKRVTAVASFSKGKTVGFYVDGVKKWSKLSASDADVVLNYNLKKGTHTVTVKISGGFITTEKFVVNE